MIKDHRATLRAALASYVLATYGVRIAEYRSAWFDAPEGDERYPFEELHLVDIYDSLA